MCILLSEEIAQQYMVKVTLGVKILVFLLREPIAII